MTDKSNNLLVKINQYCAKIGSDPLLVQGAGGNVSWKEESVLWIKASGMWLADACERNIFVPVDLTHLQDSISKCAFSVLPKICDDSRLKPSIETFLHALMPHKIVVHLHAVDILAHLVQSNGEDTIRTRIGNSLNWGIVNYYKPGADLACAVYELIKKNPLLDIVFLKNHGVVIGGSTLPEIEEKFEKLLSFFKASLSHINQHVSVSSLPSSPAEEYLLVMDSNVQQLAFNPILFERLNFYWALYPDHVVFLGEKAYTYLSWNDFFSTNNGINKYPELIFIKNVGVLITKNFNRAKIEQLICYYNVISRIDNSSHIFILDKEEVEYLVHWESEEYRLKICNKNELNKLCLLLIVLII
jgi:rhamnose utilization protein RhaD (predicted bifunctional aldolase and dehydrogenase)